MADKLDRDMLILALRAGMPINCEAMKSMIGLMDPADVEAVLRTMLRQVRAMPRAKPKPTATNQSALNRLKQLGHRS